MKIDFICYKRNPDKDLNLERAWACHIQEMDGLEREWHAERHVIGNLNDEMAKTEAINEAFDHFHRDIVNEQIL